MNAAAAGAKSATAQGHRGRIALKAMGVLAAATCLALAAGCGDSSSHSPATTSGLSAASADRLRGAVLEGTRTDFKGTRVRSQYMGCFLPKLKRVLTRGKLSRLIKIYRENGQAFAAQELNALAAPIGDACGGRRYVPELVEASKGAALSARCHATRPNGSRAPGEHPSDTFYGERGLWTVLPLKGVLQITTTTPVPPGATFGKVYPDGSLSTKFPWWGSRSAGTKLTIRGRLLDGRARRLRLTVGPGATARSPHFWATRLRFASAGCWKVRGTSGRARLAFTITVRNADN